MGARSHSNDMGDIEDVFPLYRNHPPIQMCDNMTAIFIVIASYDVPNGPFAPDIVRLFWSQMSSRHHRPVRPHVPQPNKDNITSAGMSQGPADGRFRQYGITGGFISHHCRNRQYIDGHSQSFGDSYAHIVRIRLAHKGADQFIDHGRSRVIQGLQVRDHIAQCLAPADYTQATFRRCNFAQVSGGGGPHCIKCLVLTFVCLGYDNLLQAMSLLQLPRKVVL